MPIRLSDLGMLISAALTVLTHRLLTLVALIMVFGLFCWAMWLNTWLQFAIAGAFGITIFLPILMGERKKEISHGEKDSSE